MSLNDISSTPFHAAYPFPSWLCVFCNLLRVRQSPASLFLCHCTLCVDSERLTVLLLPGPAVAPFFWTWTALRACGSESLEVPSQDSVSLCIPDVCVRRLRVFRNPWRFPPQTLSPLPFLTAVSSVCVWFMALMLLPCFPWSACILHLVLFMLLM